MVLLDPAGGTRDPWPRRWPRTREIAVERAERLPTGADVVALLVPPEIPVGAAELRAAARRADRRRHRDRL